MVSEKIFIIPENPKGKLMKRSNKVISILKDYEKVAKGGVGKIVAEKGAKINFREKEVTELLHKIYGGNFIYRNEKRGIGLRTSDILWNKTEYEIKNYSGVSKNGIDNTLRKTKGQAKRFIIDISDSKLTSNDVINQAIRLLDTRRRYWVFEIIVIKNKKIIDILRIKETN
ncbi:MAG: hypothetical protein LBT91_01430 [Bifidobacteriaceae bacterium]|jgi:hypothetical protein|nr:hypothetical protein [Bifidobacteriaceae bacterium]